MLTAIGTHTGSLVFSFGIVVIFYIPSGCVICGQLGKFGGIWRNLGELDTSYVAVMRYQLMPMLMFMT